MRAALPRLTAWVCSASLAVGLGVVLTVPFVAGPAPEVHDPSSFRGQPGILPPDIPAPAWVLERHRALREAALTKQEHLDGDRHADRVAPLGR